MASATSLTNLKTPTYKILNYKYDHLANYLKSIADKDYNYHIILNKYIIKILCIYILFGTSPTDPSYNAIRIIAYNLLNNIELFQHRLRQPKKPATLQAELSRKASKVMKKPSVGKELAAKLPGNDYFNEVEPIAKHKSENPEKFDDFDQYEYPAFKLLSKSKESSNSEWEDIEEKFTYDIANLIPFNEFIEYNITSFLSYLTNAFNNTFVTRMYPKEEHIRPGDENIKMGKIGIKFKYQFAKAEESKVQPSYIWNYFIGNNFEALFDSDKKADQHSHLSEILRLCFNGDYDFNPQMYSSIMDKNIKTEASRQAEREKAAAAFRKVTAQGLPLAEATNTAASVLTESERLELSKKETELIEKIKSNEVEIENMNSLILKLTHIISTITVKSNVDKVKLMDEFRKAIDSVSDNYTKSDTLKILFPSIFGEYDITLEGVAEAQKKSKSGRSKIVKDSKQIIEEATTGIKKMESKIEELKAENRKLKFELDSVEAALRGQELGSMEDLSELLGDVPKSGSMKALTAHVINQNAAAAEREAAAAQGNKDTKSKNRIGSFFRKKNKASGGYRKTKKARKTRTNKKL